MPEVPSVVYLGQYDQCVWLDCHVAILAVACPTLHSSRAAYYAVFDGHGGPRASVYTAENLHKNIIARFPKGRPLSSINRATDAALELFVCLHR